MSTRTLRIAAGAAVAAAAAYAVWKGCFSSAKGPRTGARVDAVVISGPAGVGKGTLIKRLQEKYPGKFGFSVSHTTRDPRAGEQDGRDYHFVTRERFDQMISNGEFLEHADVHGKLYGTSKAALEKVRSSGARTIIEVDVQGAQRLRKANLNAVYIFIEPPSFETLRERMIARGTETADKIATRLKTAESELKFARDRTIYDVTVTNNNLDAAFDELTAAIRASGGL